MSIAAARVRPAGRLVLLAVIMAALLSGMLALTTTTTADARTARYAPAAAKAHPWLKIGSKGKAVRYVQSRLGVQVTGYYSRWTYRAVWKYEQRVGLFPNGKVGPATWRKLGVPYQKSAWNAPSTKGWRKPIKSYRKSAYYGQSGSLWSSGYHTGQDFSAPSGTAVYAAATGRLSARSGGPYGNKIEIRHAGGTETWYAHLSRFVVRSGWVKAGQLIGRVGSTGNSTGPHLHFEVHPYGGGAADPIRWLRNRGVRM